MRGRVTWVVGSLLLTASSMLAQSTSKSALAPAPVDEKAPADPGISGGWDEHDIPYLNTGNQMPPSYWFWVRAEYLAYWVKSAPQPVSLVTGDPANPTQEMLRSSQSFGMFSGARLSIGGWFDACDTFGWDASIFALQQRTSTYNTASDASGNPTLAFPFTNQTPGVVGDTFFPIASPGAFAGSVQIASKLQLWGAEANGVVSLMRSGGFQVVGLAGFRYLDLTESMNISTVSSDILTSPNTILTQSDNFGTRNQFYGGQIGSRVSWQTDRFGIDLTGKIAAGATHQAVDVSGVSAQTGPGGVNGTFPGGFFAQTSNIGRATANQFTYIPSAELKISWFITPHARVFVGYDFMYWSSVVRPGNQIDRNINLSQSAVLGAGSLSGSAYPAALFNRSDFWAQGVNLGFEWRF